MQGKEEIEEKAKELTLKQLSLIDKGNYSEKAIAINALTAIAELLKVIL